jgi:hypothetical protein
MLTVVLFVLLVFVPEKTVPFGIQQILFYNINFMSSTRINVRENRRGNQEWTIQRNW